MIPNFFPCPRTCYKESLSRDRVENDAAPYSHDTPFVWIASGSALVCGFGNALWIVGIWLRLRLWGCLDVRESISCAEMQPSEGKRSSCKESRKESEKFVKGVYTRREHMRIL